MVEQMTIQSVVEDFARGEKLPTQKRAFLVRTFKKLMAEGDFTKSLGAPPEWVKEKIGSWEYKNCTWGHCVCDVLVALNIETEDDPLEAPYEFLGAESIFVDEESKRQLELELEKWNALPEDERLGFFDDVIKVLERR